MKACEGPSTECGTQRNCTPMSPTLCSTLISQLGCRKAYSRGEMSAGDKTDEDS